VLRRDTFRGLHNLSKLFLVSNRIDTIEPGAFNGLSRLAELHLRQNQLRTLSGPMFTGLSGSLIYVSFKLNKIQSIHDFSFAELTELVDLDLSYNDIKCLSNLAFRGLVNLVHVNLIYNPINEIKSFAFDDLKMVGLVSPLDLTKLKLESLAPGVFQSMQRVFVIKLDYNNIKTLNREI
jgi:Leucine-rich repeat (LRR) protein